eukprot:2847525-Rhodomonas_salina.3
MRAVHCIAYERIANSRASTATCTTGTGNNFKPTTTFTPQRNLNVSGRHRAAFHCQSTGTVCSDNFETAVGIPTRVPGYAVQVQGRSGRRGGPGYGRVGIPTGEVPGYPGTRRRGVVGSLPGYQVPTGEELSNTHCARSLPG